MYNARIEKLKEHLKHHSKDSFTLFALAKEYEKNEMDDLAIQTFKELLSNDQDYIGVYYHLSMCLIKKNKSKEAIEVLNKGISIAEKQNDLHAKSELMNAKQNLLFELNDL